jgi:hypothetical protein
MEQKMSMDCEAYNYILPATNHEYKSSLLHSLKQPTNPKNNLVHPQTMSLPSDDTQVQSYQIDAAYTRSID